MTYSSLNKKVLLIGADLHNPQIHKYFGLDKSLTGLTNYLMDSSFDWKNSLHRVNSELDCDILLGGSIPPNPAQLLSNGNIDILINEAKSIYDYIIIDTPPSLLVSDTFSIIHLSDIVLFMVRCNHTQKNVLNFIKDCIESNKVKNSALILNGIGPQIDMAMVMHIITVINMVMATNTHIIMDMVMDMSDDKEE